MLQPVMKTLSITCPDDLAEELEHCVQEGWAASKEAVVIESLRRYLFSHSPELQEAQILRDVKWGLDDE